MIYICIIYLCLYGVLYKTYVSICIRMITDIYPLEVDDHWEKSWFPLDDDKPSVEKMVVRKPTFTWWPRTSRVLHDMRISHSYPTCFKHPWVPSGWLWVGVDSSGFDECDGWSLAYAYIVTKHPNTCCLKVLGSPKQTDQTQNLRRYDWMSRDSHPPWFIKIKSVIYHGIVGCTPIPTYLYGKSLYKPCIAAIYGL